jgi:hypothetical protein
MRQAAVLLAQQAAETHHLLRGSEDQEDLQVVVLAAGSNDQYPKTISLFRFQCALR